MRSLVFNHSVRFKMAGDLLDIFTPRMACCLHLLTCILLVLFIKGDSCNPCALDDITTAVLQITVLGLTITEWMSKIREEHITYDLITAMALDFFFAYDCIQLIMMCTYDENIYKSSKTILCFILTIFTRMATSKKRLLHNKYHKERSLV